MKIVKDKITLDELKGMAPKLFGDVVKAMIDVEKEMLAINLSFHADGENLLKENGSAEENLWGINLYPFEEAPEKYIDFVSILNLRQKNMCPEIVDPYLREKIITIINRLVER